MVAGAILSLATVVDELAGGVDRRGGPVRRSRAILALTGKKQVEQATPPPEQAMESVQRDVDEVKARSGKSMSAPDPDVGAARTREQPSDPEELREEIDETREALGDTVEALVREGRREGPGPAEGRGDQGPRTAKVEEAKAQVSKAAGQGRRLAASRRGGGAPACCSCCG